MRAINPANGGYFSSGQLGHLNVILLTSRYQGSIPDIGAAGGYAVFNDEPLYPISVSTAIAGQALPTGRSWYQKRWLYAPSDRIKPPNGRGGVTLVSSRSVLAHAIAAKLVAVLHVEPEMACRAARQFTDFSDPLEAPGFDRDPGALFEGSFTYFAVYPDGSARIIRTAGVKVRRKNKVTGRTETIVEKPTVEGLLFGIGQREGCWLLPLDFIVKHVSTELAKQPQASHSGEAAGAVN